MQKIISAGIIIYMHAKEGSKFLLLYHGNGYWNFPKGKLEAREKGLDAALREIKEETGLGGKDLIFRRPFRITNKFSFIREKKKIFKIVILYLAESKRAEIKISNEHDGYGWFLYRDAARLLRYGSLRDILKKANSLL